jgi:hypothetical protein
MLQSWIVPLLITLGLLCNLAVLIRGRRPSSFWAFLARNLAIASLVALLLAAGFAFDVFTQIWVARPNSISGPAVVVSGTLFLFLSVAGLVALLVSRRKDSDAAA